MAGSHSPEPAIRMNFYASGEGATRFRQPGRADTTILPLYRINFRPNRSGFEPYLRSSR